MEKKVEIRSYNANMIFEQGFIVQKINYISLLSTHSTLLYRIWISLTRTVLSFTLDDFSMIWTRALNVAAGVKSLFFFTTTTVSLAYSSGFYPTKTVLLVVITEPKEKDGVTTYRVSRRVSLRSELNSS